SSNPRPEEEEEVVGARSILRAAPAVETTHTRSRSRFDFDHKDLRRPPQLLPFPTKILQTKPPSFLPTSCRPPPPPRSRLPRRIPFRIHRRTGIFLSFFSVFHFSHLHDIRTPKSKLTHASLTQSSPTFGSGWRRNRPGCHGRRCGRWYGWRWHEQSDQRHRPWNQLHRPWCAHPDNYACRLYRSCCSQLGRHGYRQSHGCRSCGSGYRRRYLSHDNRTRSLCTTQRETLRGSAVWRLSLLFQPPH
ncbi:hypothetical protein BC567DRAFT_195054, partial [Phyllosticta citribraziliensis]